MVRRRSLSWGGSCTLTLGTGRELRLNIDLEGDPELGANGEFAPEFTGKNDGYTEVRLARQPRRDMEGNFIDVIRGQGTLHCNADLGAATMVAIKLGVESYRQKKRMVWDAKNEKVAG